MQRYVTRLAAGLFAALTLATTSPAQDTYPSRRVTVVVPSPAGSTTDALARLVAEQLQQKWGSPVIVENNARGLNAGAEQASRAAADGYTLLVSPPLPLTVANLLYREIGYQPGQFVPVSLLAKIPERAGSPEQFPGEDGQDLVAYAKANPGKLTYASQGARLDRAPERRAARGARRHQDDTRSLSRRGACAQRSHRRPHRSVF